MKRLLIMFIHLLLFSCNDKSNHYRINCCKDETFSIDHQGILYYAESCNYQSLQKLQDTFGLKQILTQNEMTTAFNHDTEIINLDTFIIYRTEIIPWDTLLVKDNFSAELIFKIDNINKRGYYFQIRTYDKSRKIISIKDFATWADKTKKHCSGDFLKSNQTFVVTCENAKTKYEIDNNGKIRKIK